MAVEESRTVSCGELEWSAAIRDAPRFVLVGHISGLQADLGRLGQTWGTFGWVSCT